MSSVHGVMEGDIGAQEPRTLVRGQAYLQLISGRRLSRDLCQPCGVRLGLRVSSLAKPLVPPRRADLACCLGARVPASRAVGRATQYTLLGSLWNQRRRAASTSRATCEYLHITRWTLKMLTARLHAPAAGDVSTYRSSRSKYRRRKRGLHGVVQCGQNKKYKLRYIRRKTAAVIMKGLSRSGWLTHDTDVGESAGW